MLKTFLIDLSDHILSMPSSLSVHLETFHLELNLLPGCLLFRNSIPMKCLNLEDLTKHRGLIYFCCV